MWSVIPIDIMGVCFLYFPHTLPFIGFFYQVFSGNHVFVRSYGAPFAMWDGVGVIHFLWNILMFFLLVCCLSCLEVKFSHSI